MTAMSTTHSHSSLLSDVLRELDPNAPPAAPPDAMSTVSSLFIQRQEKLRKERLAREDAAKEAQFVAARATARKRLEAEEKAKAERLERLERALVPSPRVKDTGPSEEEVQALIDDEITKEAKGAGLRRARDETEEEYEERMKTLEYRVDCIDYVREVRQQEEPARYVDGFPVNLVFIHRHFRPIPEIAGGDFSCLQCKALGRRCGRTSDDAQICEACFRVGRRCLVKCLWTQRDDKKRSWKFARGQDFGYDNLDYVRKKWMKQLKQGENKGQGIQPLPAWPVKKDSTGTADQQNMPKRWQDYLRPT